MILIGEEHDGLPDGPEAVDFFHWEYVIKEKDFFLTWSSAWQKIRGAAYELCIGKESIVLPANYYLMIGDVYGELDWIKVDEIIGRQFEAFVMSNRFDQDAWQIESVQITDHHDDYVSMFPQTRNPVPVLVGDRKAILVSPVDLYNKMSQYIFNDVV